MKILFLPAFVFIISLNTVYAASFSFTENKFIEDHTKENFSKNTRQNEILNRYKKFEKFLLMKKEFIAGDAESRQSVCRKMHS